MAREMCVKERLLSAIQCREVDYVPMVIDLWAGQPPHPKKMWKNERERLVVYRNWGWDTRVNIFAAVNPSVDVKVESNYIDSNGKNILHQMWHTPGGKVEETLRVTEDWYETYIAKESVGFLSDFRTSRYVEYPFKSIADLELLEYLFPVENKQDFENIYMEYKEKRAIADEFQVPLFVYLPAGMDWLLWLFTAEEAIIKVVNEPEFTHRLLSHINKAMEKRLDILLELGIDGVVRRGWYESTDFWSPKIFREYAKPAVDAEIEKVHNAGIPYIYLMMTGIMPLLPELASMKFDCLFGAEPALGEQNIAEIRKKLQGKAIWGGISGPIHLASHDSKLVVTAVEQAFEIMGRTGFVLGTGVGHREDWPWETMAACEMIWRKLR